MFLNCIHVESWCILCWMVGLVPCLFWHSCSHWPYRTTVPKETYCLSGFLEHFDSLAKVKQVCQESFHRSNGVKDLPWNNQIGHSSRKIFYSMLAPFGLSNVLLVSRCVFSSSIKCPEKRAKVASSWLRYGTRHDVSSWDLWYVGHRNQILPTIEWKKCQWLEHPQEIGLKTSIEHIYKYHKSVETTKSLNVSWNFGYTSLHVLLFLQISSLLLQ